MENIQAVITQQAATIECNFQEVEQAINARLAEYEGAVFTEDSKVMAKKEVASLRAEKKNLMDNLREAKRTYMAPWDAFEPRAKALISLYDKPIELIDGQVKAFEEKRIAEKRELIRQVYRELAGDVADIIPLKKIYSPKWENAGTREKAIREEIGNAAVNARQALETIHGMHSEAEEEALRIYRDTLNLSDAVAHINSYERQKQEILAREAERRHQEELERIRREERERVEAERRAKEEREAALRRAEEEKAAALRKAEEEKAAALRQAEMEKAAAVEQAREEAAQEVVDSLSPELDGDTVTYEYRMELTEDAKAKLEMYLDSVGIDYEVEELTAW